MLITPLLEYLLKVGASDLHLSSGSIPMVRVNGELELINGDTTMTSKESTDILASIMTAKQFSTYQEKMELDFSISGIGTTRFRVNAFKNLYGPAAVFRLIPEKAMTLSEIGAPKILTDLAELSKGLVLIVGETGSGKSTTLAAMIDHINLTAKKHIMGLLQIN